MNKHLTQNQLLTKLRNRKPTKLDIAYCTMFANIKNLIANGHHPNDIVSDDPCLVENIADEIEQFNKLCEIK